MLCMNGLFVNVIAQWTFEDVALDELALVGAFA